MAAPVSTSPRTGVRRAVVGAVVADVVCVLALAVGGSQSHDEGSSGLTLLRISWPFLVGGLIAYVVLLRRSFVPTRLGVGLGVFVVTYVGGMALRAATGGGMAVAFLIVAALFLAVTMLGWRLLWAGVRRLRR